MILFSIACETCGSKLNVKQQAAIGQVLACPKCGSMVQVVPPKGWKPPESERPVSKTPKPPRNPHDSQATVSGELGNLDVRRTRKPLPNTPLPKAPPPKNVRSAAVNAAPEIATSSKRKTVASPPVQESVDMSAANWSADGSANQTNSRLWLAGIIGICLVGTVIVLYVLNGMLDQSGNNTQPQNPDAESNLAQATDDNNRPQNGGKSSAEKPNANPATRDDNGPETTPNQSANTKNASPPDAAAKVEQGNTEPNADEPVEPNIKDKPTDDPLARADRVLENSGQQSLTVDPNATGSNLDRFSGVGELALQDDFDLDEFRDAARDKRIRTYGIGKLFVPRPATIKIDPEKEWNREYPSLSITETTLLQLSQTLFNLCQVPIQLDGQAIAQGKFDPLAKVKVSGENLTVGQALEQAIQPLALQWKWNQDRSIVIVGPSTTPELIQARISLDPLLEVQGDEQRKQFAELIKTLIQPQSWTETENAGSLTFQDDELAIQQTQDVIGQIRTFVNRLVFAAKLNKSADDQDSADALLSYSALNRDRLQSQGTIHLVQRKPFIEVAQQLQKEEGFTLIADWDLIRSNGWNPNVEIPWQAKQVPLEDYLRELTNSMELTFRSIGPDIFQITTKENFANQTRLHVYPCGELTRKNYSGSQIIQFLQQGIAIDLPEIEFTRVAYLPQYNCIVALLPDSLHLRVESIMTELAGQR